MWGSRGLRIVKLVKWKTAATAWRQRAHKPGKLGLRTALVGLRGLGAVVQPFTLAQQAPSAHLPLGPRDSLGVPDSPASLHLGCLDETQPRSAGRWLWCAGRRRLGAAEDSREQGTPIPHAAGRSLNICFDNLGCIRLSKLFHSREVIFGDL